MSYLAWERDDDRGWTRLSEEESDFISRIPRGEIWPWPWTPRNGQEYTIRRSGDYSATQRNSRTRKQRELRAYRDRSREEREERRYHRDSYYSERDERPRRRSPPSYERSRSPPRRPREDDRSFHRHRETRDRRSESPHRSRDDRRSEERSRDHSIERRSESSRRSERSSRSQRSRSTRGDEKRDDVETPPVQADKPRDGSSSGVDETPSIHSEETVAYIWRKLDMGTHCWKDCTSHVNAILNEMRPGSQKTVKYSGEEFVVQVDQSGDRGRMENVHNSDGYSLQKTNLRECPKCSHPNDIRNEQCEECDCSLIEKEVHPDYRTMIGDFESSDLCEEEKKDDDDDLSIDFSPFADGGGMEETPPPPSHRSYDQIEDDQIENDREHYDRRRDNHRDRDHQRSRRRSPVSDSGSRRSTRRTATRVWQFEDRGRWHNCDRSWIQKLNNLRVGGEVQVSFGEHEYTLSRVSRNRGKQMNIESERERRLRASLKCPSCNGLSHPDDRRCSRCEKPLEAPRRRSSRQKARTDWESHDDWDGPKRQKFPVHGRTIKTLYHCTSKDSIDAILKSGKKMLRGQTGMLGGGIYFAERPNHACHKAFNRGYMIKAKVFVGNYHTIQGVPNEKWSFRKLHQAGYDSVYAKDGAGQGKPEWVVYNTDQVKIVKIWPFDKKGKQWDRSKGGGKVSCGI